jgi:hypothetical protein
MPRREIEYTDTKQDVQHPGILGVREYVRLWMCMTCGAAVINQDLHTSHHNATN